MGIKGTYVGMASQIAVQPFSLNSLHTPDSYINSSIMVNSPSTEAPTHGIIFAFPFLISTPTSFNKIGAYVSAAVESSKARVAIYSNDNYYPNAKLAESGELDTGTIGFKSSNISLSLEAGLYWLAFVHNDATDALTFIHTNIDLNLGMALAGGTIEFLNGIADDTTGYGILPATFAAGFSLTSGLLCPVFLRVA